MGDYSSYPKLLDLIIICVFSPNLPELIILHVTTGTS